LSLIVVDSLQARKAEAFMSKAQQDVLMNDSTTSLEARIQRGKGKLQR
jgi:hypothetical protein